jgi:hypothetical protein
VHKRDELGRKVLSRATVEQMDKARTRRVAESNGAIKARLINADRRNR